jgi:hybrid polyketide synthase / nonribosomal peptide synthetase ACE1
LEQKITYTSATPSEYLAWLRHGSDSLFQSKSWRYAIAGGEQLTTELLQGFRYLKSHLQHSSHAFHAYGSTEGSMSSNELEIGLEGLDSQHIPAGRAQPNCTILHHGWKFESFAGWIPRINLHCRRRCSYWIPE